MAANNEREKILNTLVTKLQGITRVNGYQNDIGLVDRRLEHWEKINNNELPCLLILDDGEETVLNFNTDAATLLSETHIKLVGYVRDDDENTLSTSFNQFKSDLDKCMWSFNALAGTTAEDMRITGYPFISTLPPYVVFQADVKFDYWFSKANP